MKKFIYTLVGLLFALSAWSQSNWSVGVQAGENFTNLNGDVSSQYRLGFSFGAHASHYLLEKWVLRLEANFERKGAEQIFPDNPFDPNVPNEIRLDYISLPVLLRYSTGEKWKYIIGGGLAVSYLMQETSTFENVVLTQTDDFNRVDADLIACTGLAYPIKDKLTVGFDFRANFGMVDVNRSPGVAMDLGRNISWGMFVGLNYYL